MTDVPLGPENEGCCDLCGLPVEDGEARYCALGFPRRPETGAPLGWERHAQCHYDRFGRPKSPAESRREMDEAFAKLKATMAELSAPGGAFDRLRGAMEESGRQVGEAVRSYAAQGACGRCGKWEFLHPTPTCRHWEPPKRSL